MNDPNAKDGKLMRWEDRTGWKRKNYEKETDKGITNGKARKEWEEMNRSHKVGETITFKSHSQKVAEQWEDLLNRTKSMDLEGYKGKK